MGHAAKGTRQVPPKHDREPAPGEPVADCPAAFHGGRAAAGGTAYAAGTGAGRAGRRPSYTAGGTGESAVSAAALRRRRTLCGRADGGGQPSGAEVSPPGDGGRYEVHPP